jgi:hypothetical protein
VNEPNEPSGPEYTLTAEAGHAAASQVIATEVPTGPLLGLKLEMLGAPPPLPVTVKSALLVPVPFGVCTEIGPVVAPLGTVVAMLPGPTTVYPETGVPLNATDVAPVKFAP